MRLALLAQRIRQQPIADVATTLCAHAPGYASHSPEAAVCAMLRASQRLGKLPWLLDTCLTRCLVAAALMPDLGERKIHIGFRAGSDCATSHEGHAWLSLNGRVVYDGGDDMDGHEYVEVRSVLIP